MKLTGRQAAYFKEIELFFDENDQIPPVSVLARNMGVTNNAANEALHRLARDGYIKKNSVNKWMFCR